MREGRRESGGAGAALRRAGVAAALAAAFTIASLADTPGVRRRAPRPHEYGNVVMDNSAAQVEGGPVLFTHWLHRTRYTCRLCHVDLGFSMVANDTGVMEADNRDGLYCGACHDGTRAFGAETTQEDGTVVRHCDRCHSVGKPEARQSDFRETVRGLPRDRFGNRVNWMAAEEQGLIELVDFLEGHSIERPPLAVQGDFSIQPERVELPAIVFSHEKHVRWNGCELCHPQIFNVGRGESGMDMQAIFDGRFCGACHGKVSFPNADCQLCHTEPVAFAPR